jgi:two-component system, cell cycle sensor histidine kinase and response regulator CckA
LSNEQELQHQQAIAERDGAYHFIGLALAAAQMGAWELNLETRELSVSPGYRELFGLPEGFILSLEVFTALVHPDDREFVTLEIQKTIAEKSTSFRREFRIVKSDGIRWMQGSGKVICDEDGKALRMIGVTSDITERKRIDQELQDTLTRLKQAERLAKLGTWSWDLATGAITWSEESYRIRGLHPSQPPPRYEAQAQFYTPESWSLLDRAVKRALATGESYDLELELVPTGGPVVWVHARGAAVRDNSGKVIRLQGTVQDITEQKKVADALRKSEEKFSKIFRASPIAESILAWDDSRILDVNEAFERVTGYRRDEAIGRTTADLELWVDAEQGEAALAQLRTSGFLRNFEHRFRRKDGDVGVGLLSADRLQIGASARIVTAVFDITERKRAEQEKADLEEQFLQAQKLEGIGRLAGGVAHDFNNLLTVINGYSDLLLNRLSSEDPVRAMIKSINRAGERAKGLTNQLLAFSRRQTIRPAVLLLNTVVKNSQRVIERLIGERIELVTVLDPQLGLVLADPEQIQQALLNLIVNSRDAMPDGGTLTIETSNVEVDEPKAATHPNARGGRYVLLKVADSGTGMDQQTLKNAFEPFFTTKDAGKGTGLGLSTVYGIVMQSQGWTEVESTVGAGAAFSLYFPRTDAAVSPEQTKEGVAEPDGNRTVLLVEDEEPVRAFATMVLESNGYTVLVAADSHEAHLHAAEHPGEIHLLLTDVILHGVNGKKLSESLLMVRPQLKVLFMSGYPADVIARRGVLEPGVPYLHKPFTPDEVLAAVRRLLAGPDIYPRAN